MTDDTDDTHRPAPSWDDQDSVWVDADGLDPAFDTAYDPAPVSTPALGLGADPSVDATALHTDRGDALPAGDLDPDRHDEPEALPGRPRRRPATPVTAGLAAVVLLAGGFAGGVLVQKGRGDSASGATPAAFAGGAGGGMPGAAAAGGSGGPNAQGAAAGGQTTGTQAAASSAASTTGEVSNVKGSTIYIEKTDGTTVRVVAASGATVQRTAKASMSGVHPGDTVVVSGTADEDGTVAATSVTATADGVTTARGMGGTNGGPPGGTGR